MSVDPNFIECCYDFFRESLSRRIQKTEFGFQDQHMFVWDHVAINILTPKLWWHFLLLRVITCQFQATLRRKEPLVMVPPSVDRNTQLNSENMMACFDITISNHDMHANRCQMIWGHVAIKSVLGDCVKECECKYKTQQIQNSANTKLCTMRGHVLILQYYNMIYMDANLKYDF